MFLYNLSILGREVVSKVARQYCAPCCAPDFGAFDEAVVGVVRPHEALLSWTFHYWSHLIDREVVSKVARHLSAPDFGALVGGRPAWWWGAGATLGLA